LNIRAVSLFPLRAPYFGRNWKNAAAARKITNMSSRWTKPAASLQDGFSATPLASRAWLASRHGAPTSPIL